MKRLLSLLFLCLALTCSGCKTKTDPSMALPQTTVRQEMLETTELAVLPTDEVNSEYMQMYASVLETYAQALTGRWNQGQCMEAGISILTTYCMTGENPLHNLCFALHDLDADGDSELLIAPTFCDGFVDKMVFAMYDLADGTPRLLFNGAERDRYYLCYGENGDCRIANEASGGAGHSSWFYFRYDGTGLAVETSVILDVDSAPDAPWFLGTDDTWDLDTKEAVDEAAAREIIVSFDAEKTDIHRGFPNQLTFFSLK